MSLVTESAALTRNGKPMIVCSTPRGECATGNCQCCGHAEAIRERLHALEQSPAPVDAYPASSDDWLRLDIVRGITTERLREIAEAERERGCKYCNSDMCFTCIKQLDYYGDGSLESKCADEADALRCVAYKPMSYCPMCGRRLEVESIDAGTIGGEMVQRALKKLEVEP